MAPFVMNGWRRLDGGGVLMRATEWASCCLDWHFDRLLKETSLLPAFAWLSLGCPVGRHRQSSLYWWLLFGPISCDVGCTGQGWGKVGLDCMGVGGALWGEVMGWGGMHVVRVHLELGCSAERTRWYCDPWVCRSKKDRKTGDVPADLLRHDLAVKPSLLGFLASPRNPFLTVGSQPISLCQPHTEPPVLTSHLDSDILRSRWHETSSSKKFPMY